MPPDFDIQNIRDVVAKTKGGQASAKVLIGEFAKEVKRISELPTVSPEVKAELDDLVAQANGSADDLAQAVADNPDPNPND